MSDLNLAFHVRPMIETLKGQLPTHEELCLLNDHDGADAANMLFYQAVLASPLHGPFLRFLNAQKPQTEALDSSLPEVVFFGFAQKSKSQVAELQSLREHVRSLGFQTEVIFTNDRQSLSERARVLDQFLKKNDPKRKRILLTAGWGALATRLLMQKRGSRAVELSGVTAWILYQGEFAGSALTELKLQSRRGRMALRIQVFLKRQSFAFFLEEAKSFLLWKIRFAPPSDCLVISVVGLSLRADLSLQQKQACEMLSAQGPSNGQSLLGDMIAPLGYVVPVWNLQPSSSLAQGWAALTAILTGLKAMDRALAVDADGHGHAEADQAASPGAAADQRPLELDR